MRDHFVNDSASPTSRGRRPCSLGKILAGMLVNSPILDDGELPDDMEFVRAGFINNGYPGIHGTKVAHRSEGYYSALLWRLKLTFTVRKLNKRNTTVLAHAVTH